MNSDTKAIVFTTLHLLYLFSVSTQRRGQVVVSLDVIITQ